MTIKSDRWIKQQCIHPTRLHVEHYGLNPAQAAMAHKFLHTPLEGVENLWPDWKPMIENFSPEQQRWDMTRAIGGHRIISHGTSSFGYDVRCAGEFKVFTNIHSATVDPKNFDEKSFVDVESDVCIIPPNSFALARTVEYFRIPRDVLTICLGKSTYARCGIIVNVTPLEPEWEGHVTLEFSNTTTLPAKIYANEGVAQMLFLQSDEACETSYKDRGGKYQGQRGVTLPKA